jgi:hypothetical protein
LHGGSITLGLIGESKRRKCSQHNREEDGIAMPVDSAFESTEEPEEAHHRPSPVGQRRQDLSNDTGLLTGGEAGDSQDARVSLTDHDHELTEATPRKKPA